MDFASVPQDVLKRTQLVYVCSPGNPSGKVITLAQWKTIFELSDQYDFVIAADECYSEIYFDEAMPPLGALQAAHLLNRGYKNLVVFILAHCLNAQTCTRRFRVYGGMK